MAKLVPCKACDKEIAKGVKKCPSCGKDQRSFIGRHKILTFIGAIVIVGIISGALSGGDAETTSTSNGGSKSASKQEKVHAINDVVNTGDMEIVVTKFEEKDKVGNEFFSTQASDGGVLVAIQYTMKNISDEPIGAFSHPSVNLSDEKGTKYDSDIDASSSYASETDIDNSKVLSDLNPDISVTDVNVYEISKEKFATGKWYVLVDGKQKVQIK